MAYRESPSRSPASRLRLDARRRSLLLFNSATVRQSLTALCGGRAANIHFVLSALHFPQTAILLRRRKRQTCNSVVSIKGGNKRILFSTPLDHHIVYFELRDVAFMEASPVNALEIFERIPKTQCFAGFARFARSSSADLQQADVFPVRRLTRPLDDHMKAQTASHPIIIVGICDVGIVLFPSLHFRWLTVVPDDIGQCCSLKIYSRQCCFGLSPSLERFG